MLIRNAMLTDALGVRQGDVLIENGVITAVGTNLSTDGPVLDADGLTLLPAFVDTHCHFRTPGFEYKEDIASGSRAAARGGYTFVNCMANTKPVCSSAALVSSAWQWSYPAAISAFSTMVPRAVSPRRLKPRLAGTISRISPVTGMS